MANSLRDKANARYSQARDKANDAYATGREKAEAALATSKAKAADAAKATRAGAKTAAAKTVDSVERNPLAALVGGLALGAIAAALLPRTAREDKLVGKVGSKVRNTAKAAASNARAAAKDQLSDLGVSPGAAKDQLRDLVSKVGQAASTAGSAAAKTLRKK
jgi:ElaB/YqjD/DUF883 family membrane-anchored ribosome-binding protein